MLLEGPHAVAKNRHNLATEQFAAWNIKAQFQKFFQQAYVFVRVVLADVTINPHTLAA